MPTILKRTTFDVLLLKIVIWSKKTTTTKNCIKYLTYYIPAGLKVISFCHNFIYSTKNDETKFKVIES